MQQANLYTMTIPPVTKSLDLLSKLLDKVSEAAAEKATQRRPAADFESALLSDKLIFDQYPLARQVMIATDNAKGLAARLAGVEVPKYEDTEKTVEELKARIDKTLAFLRTIKEEDVVGSEERHISLPYWDGKYTTAFEYATEYLMPNFYFHMTTAYSILRKNGIDIGKSDYIGPLPLK